MLRLEFWGGLGDTLHRLYHTNWYDRLEALPADERAEIIIVSHNPHVYEIFQWHPKASQFDIRNFPFHHPLDDPKWRGRMGLGPIVHTGMDGLPLPAKGRTYYPSPSERNMVNFAGKFLIFALSAGTKERNIPPAVYEAMARQAIAKGFTVIAVGRRYLHSQEWVTPIHEEQQLEERQGVVSLIDMITVPKTLELIQKATGVVTVHSSVCLASWFEGRPTFLAYDDRVRNVLIPLGAVGYMWGMGKPGNDQVHFHEYNAEQFDRWLETL